MNVTLQNYNTYPALSRQIPDISGQEDYFLRHSGGGAKCIVSMYVFFNQIIRHTGVSRF